MERVSARRPGRPRPTDELLKAQAGVMNAQASLMDANRALEIAIDKVNANWRALDAEAV